MIIITCKSCQTFHPVCGTQGLEWGINIPLAPFLFLSFCVFFLWLFISHLWFFFYFFWSLSFSCLRPQISSFICIRSRGLSGISAGTYSMGDTVVMFPTLLPVMTSPVIFRPPCPWDAHHWAPWERDSDYLNVNLVSLPIIANVLPPLSVGKSLL